MCATDPPWPLTWRLLAWIKLEAAAEDRGALNAALRAVMSSMWSTTGTAFWSAVRVAGSGGVGSATPALTAPPSPLWWATRPEIR
jgi:hypothetical protein